MVCTVCSIRALSQGVKDETQLFQDKVQVQGDKADIVAECECVCVYVYACVRVRTVVAGWLCVSVAGCMFGQVWLAGWLASWLADRLSMGKGA